MSEPEEPALEASQAVERAARTSYGRLLAYLAARSRDVAAAEDALGDAFVAALEAWPRTGVPDKPEAWLLTVARRRLVDVGRHLGVQAAAAGALRVDLERAGQHANSDAPFPDERLKLLFACAHPAVDEAARTPLMLQTVLGLDAARIASAFVVAPAALSQRLVRAKAKIRDAGVEFEIPEHNELRARLDAVLDAIYAAYGTSWEDVAGGDPRRRGLGEEAIWLGRLVTQLLPGEPEAEGLLALMLHCEARHSARRGEDGAYVPLAEQDVRRWSWATISEAERILATASRARTLGRFQLEAAIQSVHASRRITGTTDWEAIALLYEGLMRCAPTIGGHVGHAAAIAHVRGAAAGLTTLDALPATAVDSYQPYWALRAHLLRDLQRVDEARDAYARAMGLSEDAAVRSFLARRMTSLPT